MIDAIKNNFLPTIKNKVNKAGVVLFTMALALLGLTMPLQEAQADPNNSVSGEWTLLKADGGQSAPANKSIAFTRNTNVAGTGRVAYCAFSPNAGPNKVNGNVTYTLSKIMRPDDSNTRKINNDYNFPTADKFYWAAYILNRYGHGVNPDQSQAVDSALFYLSNKDGNINASNSVWKTPRNSYIAQYATRLINEAKKFSGPYTLVKGNTTFVPNKTLGTTNYNNVATVSWNVKSRSGYSITTAATGASVDVTLTNASFPTRPGKTMNRPLKGGVDEINVIVDNPGQPVTIDIKVKDMPKSDRIYLYSSTAKAGSPLETVQPLFIPDTLKYSATARFSTPTITTPTVSTTASLSSLGDGVSGWERGAPENRALGDTYYTSDSVSIFNGTAGATANISATLYYHHASNRPATVAAAPATAKKIQTVTTTATLNNNGSATVETPEVEITDQPDGWYTWVVTVSGAGMKTYTSQYGIPSESIFIDQQESFLTVKSYSSIEGATSSPIAKAGDKLRDRIIVGGDVDIIDAVPLKLTSTLWGPFAAKPTGLINPATAPKAFESTKDMTLPVNSSDSYTIPEEKEGYYVWTYSYTDGFFDGEKVYSGDTNLTIYEEEITLVKWTPEVETQTSRQLVNTNETDGGAELYDIIKVKGAKPNSTVLVKSILWGPMNEEPELSSNAPEGTLSVTSFTTSVTTDANGNGSAETTKIKVLDGGYYTWTDSIEATIDTDAWASQFGVAEETTLSYNVFTGAIKFALTSEEFFDTAYINGSVPEGSTMTFELWKQYILTDENDTDDVSKDTLVTTTEAIDIDGNGTKENIEGFNVTSYQSPNVKVEEAGRYYWIETLTGPDGTVLHKGLPRLQNETTSIVKVGSTATTGTITGAPFRDVAHVEGDLPSDTYVVWELWKESSTRVEDDTLIGTSNIRTFVWGDKAVTDGRGGGAWDGDTEGIINPCDTLDPSDPDYSDYCSADGNIPEIDNTTKYVVPVEPEIVYPLDNDGHITCGVESTVKVPENTDKVTYEETRNRDLITVTAKATEGYTISNTVRSRWVFDVSKLACTITPEEPTVKYAKDVDDAPICGLEGEIVLPETPGLTYTKESQPNNKVLVKVTADENFTITSGSTTEWTLDVKPFECIGRGNPPEINPISAVQNDEIINLGNDTSVIPNNEMTKKSMESYAELGEINTLNFVEDLIPSEYLAKATESEENTGENEIWNRPSYANFDVVSPTVSVETPGKYYWVEKVYLDGQVDPLHIGEARLENETTRLAAVTTTAQDIVSIDTPLADVAHVEGDVVEGSTLTFELWKQSDSENFEDDKLIKTTEAIEVTGAGDYKSPEVKVTETGTYYWVEKLWRPGRDTPIHTGLPRLPNETTRVVNVTTTAQGITSVNEEIGDTAHVTGDVVEGMTIIFELWKQAECTLDEENINNGKLSCPGVEKDTLITTTDKVKVDKAGDYNSPKVKVTEEGTYYWVENLIHPDGETVVKKGLPRLPNETTKVVKITTTAKRYADVGSEFWDTAHVTGAVDEGMRLVFDLYLQKDGDNSDKDELVLSTEPIVINGPGDYDSPKVKVDKAGTYYWVEKLIPSDSEEVVTQGKPRLPNESTYVSKVTTKALTNVKLGNVIKDTAKVEGSINPDGDYLIFELYGPDKEGNAKKFAATNPKPIFTSGKVAVDKAGEYDSPEFLPKEVGDYYWVETLYDKTTDEVVSTGFIGKEHETSNVSETPLIPTGNAVGFGVILLIVLGGGGILGYRYISSKNKRNV